MAKKNAAPGAPLQDKYIAVSGRLLYAGGGRLWVVDPDQGRVLEVPEEDGPILRVTDRFRTLPEHRKALLEAGWQDDGSGSLDAMLASLARSGALRSRTELLRRILEAKQEEPPPPIAAIAWVTRDRPQLLRRSVESAVANLQKYGRRVELRIYDDTADARVRADTRAMLAELGRREGHPVYYAGSEEKRAFATALQARASEVSAETIEFALFDPLGIGYTPGANTNAVLLDTGGKRIIHTDDDSVFRFASLPEAVPGLGLSSAADPTEVRFFSGAREREAAVELREADILTAHESLLGRSVADCLRRHGGEADCDEVSPDFLPLLQARGRVAVTMAGACGDSGLGSPWFVLWLSGRSRELALQSEEHYRDALRSREILRLASRPTLGSSAFLMSMHVGLDNRLSLPPFLPVLRNGDGLFGQVLKACRPFGLTAFLPLAVAHLPAEPRSSVPADPGRARTRAADLLMALLRYVIRAGASRSWEQELRSLGEQLADVAGLPAPEFQALSRQAWAESLSAHILALEQLLELHGGEPHYWAAEAEAWIQATQESVSSDGPLIPEDLERRVPSSEGAALWQRLVRLFGELLQGWPVLRQAAAELARQGRSLAAPL